jgi:hypothetical protein
MTTRLAVLPTASAVLFAVASVIDLTFLSAIGSKDAAPLPVMLLFGLLGLVTLAALVPARRGRRPAVIAAVACRCVSGLLAFTAFFAGAPAWIKACEAVVIVATIVALGLLRRSPAVTMS